MLPQSKTMCSNYKRHRIMTRGCARFDALFAIVDAHLLRAVTILQMDVGDIQRVICYALLI